MARPGHCWINNQVELNTASYSPGFQTNARSIHIRSFFRRNTTWRPVLIQPSLIFPKLSQRTNSTVPCAETNPRGNIMEWAHAKAVKVSSNGQSVTVLRTRAEEITIVQWTAIIEAAARLVDFKNASTQEWKKKVTKLIVFLKYFNTSPMRFTQYLYFEKKLLIKKYLYF